MKVCLVNEKSIKVTEMSKAEVFFDEKKLIFSEVLYVLKLNRNLLSIETVSSHRITVEF